MAQRNLTQDASLFVLLVSLAAGSVSCSSYEIPWEGRKTEREERFWFSRREEHERGAVL